MASEPKTVQPATPDFGKGVSGPGTEFTVNGPNGGLALLPAPPKAPPKWIPPAKK